MFSLILCLTAFLLTFGAARRSLWLGVLATLGVGYAYGITRANFLDTYTYFLFDIAVLGLYAGQLLPPATGASRWSPKQLRVWVFVLIGWPVVLMLLPFQDPLIRLVGLRGAVYFLPFILLGARLQLADLSRLAVGVAILNLAAAALATAEFAMGIERFFPWNSATDIIYRSNDLVGFTAHRIPSSFANAGAYAGTMVMTLPLLIGAWQQTRGTRWQRLVVTAALPATAVGVFMAASRTHAIVFFLMAVVISLAAIAGQLRRRERVAWLLIVVGVGWTVTSDERLQRFTTLSDTAFVGERFASSVNLTFFDLVEQYPLGNGLGGGGTSVPYFLHDRLNNPVMMENEYARIALEQGIPGLCLWMAFIAWILSSAFPTGPTWRLARQLAWVGCAAYLALGLTGSGLLTSVPQTCVMLLNLGWMAARWPAPQRQFGGAARLAGFGDLRAHPAGK